MGGKKKKGGQPQQPQQQQARGGAVQGRGGAQPVRGGATQARGGNQPTRGNEPKKQEAKKDPEVELVTPGAAAAGGKGGKGGKGNVEFKFEPPAQGTSLNFNFQKPAGLGGDDDDEDDEDLEGIDFQSHIKKMLEERARKNIEEISPSVYKRVKALKQLNQTYKNNLKQFREEIQAIEQKYLTLNAPIMEKRRQIVEGSYEPTDSECAPVEGEEASKFEPKKDDDPNEKGIPNFWLKALKGNMLIEEMISERDEKALAYLTNVSFSEVPGESFTLEFHFKENPFFTNKILTKTYKLTLDDNWGELSLDTAKGTDINWKDGQKLTVEYIKKKTKKKGNRPAKTVTVEQECPSFFRFFSPPDLNNEDDDDDDEEEYRMEELVEEDYEIGRILKERVIPQAVLFFTGEAPVDVPYSGLDDDDMEFGEGDDDDDDDDDDDVAPPKRGGGGSGPTVLGGGGAPGGAVDAPPECKQQ